MRVPQSGSLCSSCLQVEHVLVYENPDALSAADTDWVEGRDAWYGEQVSSQEAEAAVEWVDAEDPLFLL